jgi:PAS domain-containing protein
MVPIRDDSGALLGWYGANTDIDDLKRAQMKLRHHEKELRQMTDATQLPIIVFSAEGRLLYANRFSLTYGGLSLVSKRSPMRGERGLRAAHHSRAK